MSLLAEFGNKQLRALKGVGTNAYASRSGTAHLLALTALWCSAADADTVTTGGVVACPLIPELISGKRQSVQRTLYGS